MKTFTKLSAGFFGLVAALHLARLLYGWEAAIGGLEIPLWVSGIALVVGVLLSWGLWKESR